MLTSPHVLQLESGEIPLREIPENKQTDEENCTVRHAKHRTINALVSQIYFVCVCGFILEEFAIIALLSHIDNL